MREILIVVVTMLVITLVLVGAVVHEFDLSRNFKKTGDAKSFFLK